MSACGTRTQYLSGLLLLVLLLTISCGQSPRIVVVPSAGGNVVFTSSRALDGSDAANGATNIWVINSDGTGPRPLTKLSATGASSTTPVLSPNKSKIAFNSMRALDGSNAAIGAVNIWVMNTDGSSATPLTKITTTPVNSIHAAWSPDSSKIAYDSTRALNGFDASGLSTNIWLMSSDGSNSSTLTAFRLASNVFPLWSPDGTKLLFESSRSLTDVDLDIAVTNIWVMNADGSGQRHLTSLTAASNYQPTWSSDGRTILFCSSRALDGTDAPNANATYNIWLMNSDGTAARPLTRSTASGADSAGPRWLQ